MCRLLLTFCRCNTALLGFFCTGISDDSLGVNRHLSVLLHKSCSVSVVGRMYFFTFLMLLNEIYPVAVCTDQYG